MGIIIISLVIMGISFFGLYGLSQTLQPLYKVGDILIDPKNKFGNQETLQILQVGKYEYQFLRIGGNLDGIISNHKHSILHICYIKKIDK